VPDIVASEFAKNRSIVQKRLSDAMNSHLKNTRRIIANYPVLPLKQQGAVVQGLNSIDGQLPAIREKAETELDLIEMLLNHSTTRHLQTSGNINDKAVKRGLAKKAPFTRNKNSLADALIIEMFAVAVCRRSSSDDVFSFVTSNANDFSHKKDSRLPHPDIGHIFDAKNVFYDTNIGAALNRLELGTVPDNIVSDLRESGEWLVPRCSNCARGLLSITDAEPSSFNEGWSYFLVCDNCGHRTYSGDLQ
jgi:hypothetical protein